MFRFPAEPADFMAQLTLTESVTRTLYCRFFELKPDFITFDSLSERVQDFTAALKAMDCGRFVIKPDHAIGKRGEHGLLGMNLTAAAAARFVSQWSGMDFHGVRLTRFIAMPFIPHDSELYISLQTDLGHDLLLVSEHGGMKVEEQWGKVRSTQIGLTQVELETAFQPIEMRAYLNRLLAFFRHYNFTYLEINPLVTWDGGWLPLDFKSRLDDCALFGLRQEMDIGTLLASNKEGLEVERKVARLDEQTGASLKLKILNQNGRIWPMIAGGGASVIYFDLLVDAGYGSEIAMYGEYSGNPSNEMTYAYTLHVINGLLASKAKNKILLLAGANANFTDILDTFKGIIRALEERSNEIRKQDVVILVRRGGPRSKEAFERMRRFGKENGLKITIEGADLPLPHILKSIPSNI